MNQKKGSNGPEKMQTKNPFDFILFGTNVLVHTNRQTKVKVV